MPKLKSLAVRWKRLTGPAPLADFADYNEYWQKRGTLERVYRRWRIAAEHIENGASVLDVGCGHGEFLKFLMSIRPDACLKGVDVSDKSVEETRRMGFDADVLDVNCQGITGTFDYVTCFEVLEHIPEAEAAIVRLKQAFRRQLIVSIPNIGHIGCRARLGLFGRFPLTNCIMHIKEHVRHWTSKDFTEWARHHGLTVVRMEGQYGVAWTPWRSWPSLFAAGMVYVLEHQRDEAPDTTKS